MNDIERKLLKFKLGDEALLRAMRAVEIANGDQRNQTTYLVETVTIIDGKANILNKEEAHV